MYTVEVDESEFLNTSFLFKWPHCRKQVASYLFRLTRVGLIRMNDITARNTRHYSSYYSYSLPMAVMKHPCWNTLAVSKSDVRLVCTKQFQQLWLMVCLLMVYWRRKDQDWASTRSTLISAAPAAAAGMWKVLTHKKKRRITSTLQYFC